MIEFICGTGMRTSYQEAKIKVRGEFEGEYLSKVIELGNETLRYLYRGKRPVNTFGAKERISELQIELKLAPIVETDARGFVHSILYFTDLADEGTLNQRQGQAPNLKFTSDVAAVFGTKTPILKIYEGKKSQQIQGAANSFNDLQNNNKELNK